jgi:hypothetical protein
VAEMLPFVAAGVAEVELTAHSQMYESLVAIYDGIIQGVRQ